MLGLLGEEGSVKDASFNTMYSFLPASWAGDTHEETDVLPISDREEKGKYLLNCHTDSLEAGQVLYGKVLFGRQRSSLEAKQDQGMRLLAVNKN